MNNHKPMFSGTDASRESEAEHEVRSSIRRFCEQELPRYQTEQHYNSVPRDLFKGLAALGLCGLQIEERFGGSASDAILNAAIAEEIAAADLGPAIFTCVHNMVSGLVQRYAQEPLQQALLPSLANGTFLGAFALSEPSAGSDARALRTTARVDGGQVILSGEKCYITSAGFADVYVTFAKRPDLGPDAISAIVIDPPAHGKKPQDRPGFRISPPDKKMGCELSPIASLSFDNLSVPAQNILGDPAGGYAIALSGLAGGRISIAACANGLSRSAIALATSHLTERSQFGSKLIEFQGLQFMLADMQMQFEAARLLTREAAHLLATNPAHLDNRLYPSYAKCFASDAAMRICTDAVQLLGGAGYLRDYKVEKLMRDAKMLQIVEGTNQIQRMVIARELIKRRK